MKTRAVEAWERKKKKKEIKTNSKNKSTKPNTYKWQSG
jgi:hypothetical protein